MIITTQPKKMRCMGGQHTPFVKLRSIRAGNAMACLHGIDPDVAKKYL
jgi:hypothetical protein